MWSVIMVRYGQQWALVAGVAKSGVTSWKINVIASLSLMDSTHIVYHGDAKSTNPTFIGNRLFNVQTIRELEIENKKAWR